MPEPGILNGLGALLAGRSLRATRPLHFFRPDGSMPDTLELPLTLPVELGPLLRCSRMSARRVWLRREQVGDLLTECGLCEPAVELCRILLAEDSPALGLSDGDVSCGQDHEHGFGEAERRRILDAFG